jgi:hypothetical protein
LLGTCTETVNAGRACRVDELTCCECGGGLTGAGVTRPFEWRCGNRHLRSGCPAAPPTPGTACSAEAREGTCNYCGRKNGIGVEVYACDASLHWVFIDESTSA